MQAALALAVLALAKAAVTDVPHEVVLDSAVVVHPPATRAVLSRYGLQKPTFDRDFIAFAHSVGAPDTQAIASLRDLYDEPVLLFFQDPLGEIISYYALGGMSHILPEVRSSIAQLLGSADAFTVTFKPERILGDYKSILPNYFFQPIKDIELIRFLSDPIPTPEDPTYMFNRQELMSIFPHLRAAVPSHFDLDDLPLAYRLPVPLQVSPYAKSYFKLPSADYQQDYAPAFYKDFTPAFYPYSKEYPIPRAIPIDPFYSKAYPEPTFYPRNYPESVFYPKSYIEPTIYPKSYIEPAFYPRSYPESIFYPKSYPEQGFYPRGYPEQAFYPRGYPEPNFYPKSYPEFAFYPKSFPVDSYPKPFYPLVKSVPLVESSFYPKTIINPVTPTPFKPFPQTEKPVSVIPPAYRFIKADYPYFTAIPTVLPQKYVKALPQTFNECAFGNC